MLFSSVQNKLVMFVILNLYLWLLIYSSLIGDGCLSHTVFKQI